jgi:hypothetical protein
MVDSIAPRPDTDPDRIWLPNALVTSAAAETSPIELVPQGQDVVTLRLLINLYHAQNLRGDGGSAGRSPGRNTSA